MNSDIIESELIFKVHRLKNKDGEWLPAIEDIKSHDITPSWAAGMAYIILDRYVSCVDDVNQTEFYEETLHWLTSMLKENKGSEYIDKIKPPEVMD